MNSVFFRLISTKEFFSSHFWLLASARKKISFCPKNNGFAWVWGGAAAPSPLALTPVFISCITCTLGYDNITACCCTSYIAWIFLLFETSWVCNSISLAYFTTLHRGVCIEPHVDAILALFWPNYRNLKQFELFMTFTLVDLMLARYSQSKFVFFVSLCVFYVVAIYLRTRVYYCGL